MTNPHPNHPDAQRQEPAPLPHDIEAEQQVLGAILMDNRAHEALAGWLRVDHFFNDAHRRIYAACEALIDRGEPANPVSLRRLFEADADLEHVGGADYLAKLQGAVVTVRDVDFYGRRVKALAARRALVLAAEDIRASALDTELEDAVDILARAERQLAAAGEGETGDVGQFEPFSAALEDAMQSADAAHRGGEAMGLSTGIKELDFRMGKLQKTRLILIAGRPGMGKSALAFQIAVNVAAQQKRVAFVSLEMPGGDLAQRAIADAAGVPYADMQAGRLDDIKMQRMVLAHAALKPYQLMIRASGPRDLSAIRSALRRAGRDQPIDLVVIDYLQLIRATSNYRGNKVAEVGEISQGLKELAIDLEVPVIALSQLSRAVETRDDKRPQLSDLRESGALEQDADTIGFVYREAYYLERKVGKDPAEDQEIADKISQCRGICEVVVAKRRMGPSGVARLYFDPALNRFRDLADRPDDRQEGMI